MSPESSEALAYWIARNEPDLWHALLRSADAAQSGPLGGIADFFRSVGSSVTGAVKNAGTYLRSSGGLKSLTELGGAYLASEAQKKALELQMLNAQVNRPPAPIQNVPMAGATVPVYTPMNRPLDAALYAQLTPSYLERYGTPILIGGIVLLAAFVFTRN